MIIGELNRGCIHFLWFLLLGRSNERYSFSSDICCSNDSNKTCLYWL